jgi:hypothetical protein
VAAGTNLHGNAGTILTLCKGWRHGEASGGKQRNHGRSWTEHHFYQRCLIERWSSLAPFPR